MPCDTRLRQGQTLSERIDQIDAALKRLEKYLQGGNVKLNIGPTGGIAFAGWADRDDVTDVCAFRTLQAQNSSALRMAVARAEALSGRKVNQRAIVAGHHSHDGGGSWHGGH